MEVFSYLPFLVNSWIYDSSIYLKPGKIKAWPKTKVSKIHFNIGYTKIKLELCFTPGTSHLAFEGLGEQQQQKSVYMAC